MSLKHFPSNPDLQNLQPLEWKGVTSIREFINQLLDDPSLVSETLFKDASLIFASGAQSIPLRVLNYLEYQSVSQLNSRGYVKWDAEIEGAHTNTVRLNLRDPNAKHNYFYCAITPADGIFLLEYRTAAMDKAKLVKNLQNPSVKLI